MPKNSFQSVWTLYRVDDKGKETYFGILYFNANFVLCLRKILPKNKTLVAQSSYESNSNEIVTFDVQNDSSSCPTA